MRDLAVAGVTLLLFLAYLFVEAGLAAKGRTALPTRIAVTGTRGKSSVVRLIAAGLRAGGKRVAAKTTGSRAVFIAPDGEETPLRRRGRARILEQSGILRRAAGAGAEVLVSEVMSIRPETYAVELGRILRPQILVVTNVRLDHLSDIGTTLEEAALAFAQGVPLDSKVFFLLEDAPPALASGLRRRGVVIVDSSELDVDEALRGLPYPEWKGNLKLALGVCEALGVARDVALSGMRTVRPDFGSLKAWRIEMASPPRPWVVISAFAANEPESTLAALKGARERFRLDDQRLVGLLNLRSDRGDRTEQWCKELAKTQRVFDRLFVTGGGATAAVRCLRRAYGVSVAALQSRKAERVLEEIIAVEPNGGTLFGFGNICGLGGALVEHWDRVGESL